MMIKGNISILTSLDPMYLPQGKILFVGEPDRQLVQLVNGVTGSILLPPYDALMCKLDHNNLQQFDLMYKAYLTSKEVIDFIAAIIKALMDGVNILIYSTQDEYELYLPNLIDFIFTQFGIMIGTPNNLCGYDGNHDHVILNLLYHASLLNYQQYITMYPAGIYFGDDMIYKMMVDNRIAGNVVDYRDYFFRLKEDIKLNNNQMLNIPFRSAGM